MTFLRCVALLTASLSLAGCALSISNRTAAAFPENPAGLYPIEAEVTNANVVVRDVYAVVSGVQTPMTQITQRLWRGEARVSPCQRGFTMRIQARGSPNAASTYWTYASDPATGVSRHEISGNHWSCTPQPGVDLQVNTLIDAPDAAPGDGACATAAGACSLRAAIMETNARPGPDRIALAAGVYPLTIAGVDDTAAAGDLDVTDSVIIDGYSATVDASGLGDRVFDLHDPHSVLSIRMNGLTVRGGEAEMGGGIHNRLAQLRLADVIVEDNVGLTTAGGIMNAGPLLMQRAIVRDNDSRLAVGGGLRHESGALVIEQSAFLENSSNQHGGAMSLIGGDATIVNTTLSGNTASTYGGAIHANSAVTILLRNVTIAGNVADSDRSGAGDGGGIKRTAGAGDLRMANTIVAGNTSAYGVRDDCAGAITSLDYNLIGVGDGCAIAGATGASTIGSRAAPVDARLDPPAPVGLAPPTMAPRTGSPALDRGDPLVNDPGPNGCPSRDQRNGVRPLDGDGDGNARCDIGAMEAG